MLQKLADLDLSYNLLNGTIPCWVFSIPSLHLLKLHHNRFSGVADELKMNQALKDLDLSHNQLSGLVPRSLANLINLVRLDLSSNNITDDIGIEVLTTMQRLEHIGLSYNHLSWRTSIKGSKITLPSLEVLLFSSCELKDFPHFLRNLKTLWVLDLSNNKIHGPIPNWFSNMRWDSLSHLNISHNSLTGHLEHLHYYNLESLDLKFNLLQDPLPSSICNMSSLTFLDLSHNYFSDSIPSCLGSMSRLTVLDLRRNNFSGSLPSLCSRSTSYLRTIVLNGQIREVRDDRFNGRLKEPTCPPLSKECGTSDPSHVPQPLESEEEEDESFSFSGFTWESVVIGYSFGLVVGTVVWSLMFNAGKPKWFVECFEGIFPKKMRRPKKRYRRRQT
ncbi:hypothetical protein HAX54_033086 [Datura stramonium]|uniref:Uncharacterized protein n=1 Tax=Datura stramonium TaxID=4076 RepID=A0ABS8VD25_DATST|nr:hypothetical protein [Datura stramonium]